MTEAEMEARLQELREIEVSQRGIIRHNAYFGSHRGYKANDERRQQIIKELRDGGAYQ